MIAVFVISFVLAAIPVVGFIIQQKDFFAPLYEGLFIGVYGDYLGQHLYGFDGEGFNDPSLYIPCGFITYFTPLALVLLFYYLINSPRFNRWYHWLIFLALSAIICFAVSYGWVYADYDQGYMAESIAQYIEPGQLIAFGMVNALYGIILFVLFSFILRNWSANCSTTPFPQ